MKKARKKSGKGNWKQMRVCFLVSDPYHKLTPISITMPARVREHSEEQTIYEGPINKVWEDKVSPRINAGDILRWARTHELVGVLIACDEYDRTGMINWLVQSDAVEASEAGADKIKGEAA